MQKHVLILGCGRSGTSIFGELFEHLPGYSYFSEPPFEQLAKLNYKFPVAVKVPTESPGFSSSTGLSFPLEHLLRIFPEPRQWYWQIRHPLDTVCSLRVGISKNWGHHPRPPDWQQWLSRPLLERCAHHWQYLNEVGYAQIADMVKVKRFEDMVSNPLAFAHNICEDTGCDQRYCEPALQAWAKRVQNSNNANFVEAATSRPYSTTDHQVRIGRWKENLTKAEIERIWPIIRETSVKFGYNLNINT